MSFVEKGNDHYVWRKRCPIYAVWDSLKTQILLNNYRGQFRGGVYFDNEDDALTAVLGKPLTERCDTDLNHYRFARSEEQTSELRSPMRISYAVCCLNTKNKKNKQQNTKK